MTCMQKMPHSQYLEARGKQHCTESELSLVPASARRSKEVGMLTVLCDNVNVSKKVTLLLNSCSEIAKYLPSDLLSSSLPLCCYTAFMNFVLKLSESI